MVRNGKEPENPSFSLVAATFEKAITYVFAERLIRNAQVTHCCMEPADLFRVLTSHEPKQSIMHHLPGAEGLGAVSNYRKRVIP